MGFREALRNRHSCPLWGLALVYIIAVFTSILAYKLYKRENEMLGLLLIPAVYPLFYTSLTLAKYISDGGIVLILALVYIIAEIFVKLEKHEMRK